MTSLQTKISDTAARNGKKIVADIGCRRPRALTYATKTIEDHGYFSKFSRRTMSGKCHLTSRQRKLKFLKMEERSDGCSRETSLAPCEKRKKPQR